MYWWHHSRSEGSLPSPLNPDRPRHVSGGTPAPTRSLHRRSVHAPPWTLALVTGGRKAERRDAASHPLCSSYSASERVQTYCWRLTSPPLAYSITKQSRSLVWKAYFSVCNHNITITSPRANVRPTVRCERLRHHTETQSRVRPQTEKEVLNCLSSTTQS